MVLPAIVHCTAECSVQWVCSVQCAVGKKCAVCSTGVVQCAVQFSAQCAVSDRVYSPNCVLTPFYIYGNISLMRQYNYL